MNDQDIAEFTNQKIEQAAEGGEAERVAQAVKAMELKHAVITSVNRDDLADGGAFIFHECIRLIHERVPDCKVEVLTPDFAGNWLALRSVLKAGPAVLKPAPQSSMSSGNSAKYFALPPPEATLSECVTVPRIELTSGVRLW